MPEIGTSKNSDFAGGNRFLSDISRPSATIRPFLLLAYFSTTCLPTTVSSTPSTSRFTQNRPISTKGESTLHVLCPCSL